MNEQLYATTSSIMADYGSSIGSCNIEATTTHNKILPTIQSYEQAMEYNWEYDVILSSSILKKLTNRIKELESLNLEQWRCLIEEGDGNE